MYGQGRTRHIRAHRYMQACEAVRTDVTVLNLSMMTFKWWQSKRALYPEIKWPGTHYTKENTLEWQSGAFTIGEFLDANIDRFPGGIYLGGRLNYADQSCVRRHRWAEAEDIPRPRHSRPNLTSCVRACPRYLERYEWTPFGLTERVRDRHAASERSGVKLYEWAATTRAAWNTALDALETVRPSMLEPIVDATHSPSSPDTRLASLPPEAGGDTARFGRRPPLA